MFACPHCNGVRVGMGWQVQGGRPHDAVFICGCRRSRYAPPRAGDDLLLLFMRELPHSLTPRNPWSELGPWRNLKRPDCSRLRFYLIAACRVCNFVTQLDKNYI
jgi:hypothetical protein